MRAGVPGKEVRLLKYIEERGKQNKGHKGISKAQIEISAKMEEDMKIDDEIRSHGRKS